MCAQRSAWAPAARPRHGADRHYAEPLDLQTLANLAGISKYHLLRSLAAVTVRRLRSTSAVGAWNGLRTCCGSCSLYRALGDPGGVLARRVQLWMKDWGHTQDKLADTKQRMVAVLDELELIALITSSTGISAVGAATILAETGGGLGVLSLTAPDQTRTTIDCSGGTRRRRGSGSPLVLSRSGSSASAG